MNTKYSYSTDEENYTGEFDTPEDAAREAFAEDSDLDAVWVGENMMPRLENYVCGDRLIDTIVEDNPEQFGGDWSTTWVSSIYGAKKEIAELEGLISEVVKQWAEKHKFQPDFFNIENARKITREEIEPHPAPSSNPKG